MSTETPAPPATPGTSPRRGLRELRSRAVGVEVHDEEVTVHGHPVRYLRAGDSGPVVLLIHGLAGDADTWRTVIPDLARSCRVIAPDMLGHGLSAKPKSDYSLGSFASGIRDLMTLLGHDRVTVVGHSLGGGVAMQFAYQFPEHTERLVLVSSGGLGRGVSPALRAVALPGAGLVIPLGANGLLAPVVECVADRLTRWGVPMPLLVREAVSGYVRMAETPTRRAFVTTVRGVIDVFGQRIDARDRLYLTELIPTLFVVGDADTVIPSGHSIRAAGLAPGARLEVLRGAGHVPFWDDPKRFAEVFLDFVATTEPAEVDREAIRAVLRRRSGLQTG